MHLCFAVDAQGRVPVADDGLETASSTAQMLEERDADSRGLAERAPQKARDRSLR